MAVLVLLRHGESAWNAADMFTGWIDIGPSEHGRKQAQRAGAILTARDIKGFPSTSISSCMRHE
jgi:2,3-bisphosphoglycerate-dependent phosphoglycerate mutase